MAQQHICASPFFNPHRVTSPFGAVGDTPLRDQPHKGIDFGCPVGTPLVACFDGKILIQRKFDDGSKLGTRLWLYNYKAGVRAGYCHMSEFHFYVPGEEVKTGDLIGYSGATGNVSAPHLHFQLENIHTGDIMEPIIVEQPL